MKNTKSKLLTSVLTLVMCIGMLFGTTFAWFTDSASTGVNKIQAGTLEVGLEMKNANGNWVNAEDQKLAWQKANASEGEAILWEPGATYKLPTLKITNKGNLSLQFKVLLSGLTGNEELLDALEFTVKPYYLINADGNDYEIGNPIVIDGNSIENIPYELPQLLLTSDPTFVEMKEFIYGDSEQTGTVLLPSGSSSEQGIPDTCYYDIEAKMKTTADNTYQGKTLDDISVTIVASQVTVENDSNGNTYDKFAEYPTGSGVTNTASVKTADELQAVLTSFTDAGSGNTVVNINENITLAEGETWTPVTVDGYNGAGVITINGNGYTIKGLNAPLIDGGFAGESGVVINDLTLSDVNINDTNETLGLGAFISTIDSMPKIELNNCHLKDSIIVSTGGARVGGLIGWTAGYNNPNDGPVDTYITITNCSVKDSNITAAGSVGAIIGHAGSNPATYHNISNCTVKNTKLNSTDDGGWRVGVVVGTANVGEVTISGITESDNTLTQTGNSAPEHSNLYGRFVPQNGSGKLTIDGFEISE